MNRTQLACYCLIASASVLAGLLVVHMQGREGLSNTAHADMVINRGNLTVMTAITGNGEESLFVLDNTSQRLLVYTTNVGKNSLDFADSYNLAAAFGAGGGGGGGKKPR